MGFQGVTTSGGGRSLLSGFTSAHNFLLLLSGGRYFQRFTVFSHSRCYGVTTLKILEVTRSILFYDGVLKNRRLSKHFVERHTLRELYASVSPKITTQGVFRIHPMILHTRDLLTQISMHMTKMNHRDFRGFHFFSFQNMVYMVVNVTVFHK